MVGIRRYGRDTMSKNCDATVSGVKKDNKNRGNRLRFDETTKNVQNLLIAYSDFVFLVNFM